jgi:hypothetical protein
MFREIQSFGRSSSRHADMISIPGGIFRMGSDRHYGKEAPAHRVTVDAFAGIGASHQTGWTGPVAPLIENLRAPRSPAYLEAGRVAIFARGS